jgi:hypothetical protein
LTPEPSCKDEARVGQKGTHAYVWAPIGSRPLMVRDNRHDSAYIFGAICPDRAVGAAIVMPEVNAEAMRHHLKVIGAEVSPLAHAVLICDGAGWHQTGGTIARTRQHHPAALAALLSRTELDGECLALLARKHSRLTGLGHIRRHRRGLLRRLALSNRRSCPHPIHRTPSLGIGQPLSGLV